MPTRRSLLERLSADDPNHDVIKQGFHELWADSHGLVADGFAGLVSLNDFVECCIHSFDQGAQIHLAFKDANSIPAKCREIDRMARESIRLFNGSLSGEAERLGNADVEAAIGEFSQRVNEIAARAKQQIHERALAESAGLRGRIPELRSNALSGETLAPLKEPEDTIDFGEEGWLGVPHADWRKDADYSMKPPPYFRPVKAARLDAIATLRKQAADAVQSAVPPTKQQAELSLWPVFSKYAEDVFNKMAEAKLNARGRGGRSLTYGRWLRSKCLPAVVDDVCRPIFGQFPITIRNVVEIIGESQSPEIELTRRALWGLLTEVVGGPFTQNLEKRLSAQLEGRINYWEARALQQQVRAGRSAEVAHAAVARSPRVGFEHRSPG